MVATHLLVPIVLLFCSLTGVSAATEAKREFEFGQYQQYTAGNNARAKGHYLSSWRLLVQAGSVVDIDFDAPGMMNDLGVLLASSDDHDRAIKAFEYALLLNSTLSSALSNLGGIFVDIGRGNDALSLYLRAIEADPGCAELYHNAAYCFHTQGDNKAAIIYWEKALMLKPRLNQARTDLATTLCTDGLLKESQLHYDAALACELDGCAAGDACTSQYWVLLFQKKLGIIPVIQEPTLHANLRIRNLFIEETINITAFFPSNSIMDPSKSIGCSSLGYYLLYQGFDNLLPRKSLADAYLHVASSSLRFVAPFLTSAISKVSQIDLGGLIKSDSSATPLLNSISTGKSSNKKIRIGFISAFFYRHSVGLLLGGLIEHINRENFEVFVITIDRGPFSRIDSITTSILGGNHTMHLHWNTNIHSVDSNFMKAQIGQLNLDILMYGEIGMESTSYFLAFSRLARRSVVFWGHAVTSGIVDDFATFSAHRGINISLSTFRRFFAGGPDYFVSSVLFEDSRNGGRHCSQLRYVERLILMQGMTTYFRRPASPLSACDLLPELNLDCSSENPFFSCNNRPETHFPDISCQDVCLWNRLKLLRLHKVEVLRALKCNVPESQRITACASDFRSSDIVHLYGLPQTLYKISPLFDNIIVKILLLDPVGYIIIPSPPHKAWAQVFLNRLAELLQKNELDSSVHTVLERIIFMRTLNETEYITLCSIFDVVLDPFPVGGGRSSLEIFSTANVIVLQENTTSVLHLTSGMYRAMGIEVSLCCIAQDEDQYVAKSYAIVSNTSYREKLQHQIFNQKNVLYENRSVLSEWEALLKAVSSSPRPELGVCSTMNKEQEKVLSKESCSEKELAPENMHYKNIVKYPYRCEPIVLKSKTDAGLSSPIQEMLLNQNIIYSRGFSGVNTYDRVLANARFLDGEDNLRGQCFMCKRRIEQESITIEVRQDHDWRKVCFDATQQVLDRLQRFFICSTVGRAVERPRQNERHRVRLWLKTASNFNPRSRLKGFRVVNEFSVRDGDEKDDAFWSIKSQNRERYEAEALEFLWMQSLLGDVILSKYLPAEIESSSFSISLRKNISNSWLDYAINEEMKDLHSPCCTVGVYANISTSQEVQCCPNLADEFSVKKMHRSAHIIYENDSKLTAHHSAAIDNRVTIGMTTCKRLPLFLRAMSRLIAHIGHFPNSIIREVVVIDDNSSPQDRKIMLDTFPMVRYIMKPEFHKGHANSLNYLLRSVSTRFFAYIEDDWELFDTFFFSKGIDVTQRDGNYSSFTDVLRASISILVHNSDVHEVLFNSQWNRNCSLGIMSFCDPKLLAAGGWFKMNHNDWGFPYSLHEFGISPRPVFTDNESHELQRRRHDFSYWPGFSLNPGLWDLSKLKGIIKRQEFCQVESGISKKPVKSDTNSMYQCCNLFSESDPSFEHQFALLGHLHGVQVAYLHAVLFSHIGVDMSAYKLNGFFRPWD